MKLNQKGFSAVVGLLVVIALTLIVGVGFYIVNANKDKKEETKISETTSQKTGIKPTEQPKVEYVEFKELGFKIKKTDKMKDWSYVDEAGVPMTKYVQSAAHVKQIDECNKGGNNDNVSSPSSKSFAAFSRADGKFNEAEAVGSQLAKQFDTFHITIGYPNGGSPCFNEKGVGYPVAISPEGAQEALVEALKNAEKL